MNTTQISKLAERIAYRVLNCGYELGDATRDVMDWFGVIPEADLIAVTCEAGRRITETKDN